MTLPVSNYQELLIQVRELTHETIRLQRQLSSDLFDNADPPDVNHNFHLGQKNYENGKHLTDNVIRQCEKSRKNEAGQNSLAEYNNFRFRPRFCQNLDSTEGIRAGELTSRLLTWRSRSHRPITLQEDAEGCQKRAERLLSEECRVSHGPVGVGVEGVSSWRAQRRPHDIEVSTPLAGVAAHELESSVDGAAFNPVVAAAATSTRCLLVKNALKTPSSSSTSLPVNVHNARPRLYLGSVIAETSKEDAMEPEVKEEDERRSSTPSPEVYARRSKRYNEGGSSEEDNKPDTLQSHRLPSSYRGTWPIRRDVWANQQMGFSTQQSTSTTVHNDVASVMSFSSNSGGALGCSSEMQGDRRLGAKVDVVYNLLGMLGSTEGREDMSATLLSMSNSIDNCLIMRQSGCLPLLVQLIHAPGQDPETRERASRALHNIVYAKNDERAGRREARVLRFLEQLRDYCQALRTSLETGQVPDDLERHPGTTIAALMKLSFDEAHRHAMCQLGGLHAVAELIEMDHMAHGSECDDQNCITLRRYAGMALTNLTFGDGNNKALLCSFREFMKALVSQLRSPSDDLRQVTASVLRNLSWRADTSSKQTLREVGAVTGLMKAAMEDIQIKQQSSSLHSAVGFDTGMSNESHSKTSSEKKYTLRYKNAIPDRLKSSDGFNGLDNLRCTNSTMSWSSAPDQESACSQNLLHSSVEDNLPQSISSALKTGSQSSISEETEMNVCTKTEYMSTKSGMDASSSLLYVSNSSPVKDTVNFGNVYDKTMLHQHNSLNTVQKAISPTVTHRTEGNLFSDYAETDLDQPTDYSLRYAERSLEEEKPHSHYFTSNDQELIHEDTVKTYCTEGTPHGTSLNSSRAASASDLQEDSRQRNLLKKIQEQGNLQDNEELNLECSNVSNEKRGQTLHYFEANIKNDNVEEDGHTSTKSSLSLRTTLAQVSSSNLQYDESDNVATNSAKSKPDMEKKYDTQSTKNFPNNGVNSYVTSSLKASNDSGYQVSDGDEDDEDLLTACINIGMQNNRHRHSFIGNNFEKVPRNESNLARYQTSVALDQMEWGSSVDSTINSLETKELISEEMIDRDGCTNNINDNSSNMNITSDYSQNTAKFMQKVVETKMPVEQSNQVAQNELDKVRNTGHNLILGDDNLCKFSLTSNLRNSPILHETVVFNTEPTQQQYLSSIDTQSNEDMSSLIHNDFIENYQNIDDDSAKWENDKVPETLKDKVTENSSMQQSYTKVTDSESSESIDSVEQSEHALLELCIQPGLTKTMDNIQLNTTTVKRSKVDNERHVSSSGETNKMYNDTCEVDGIKKEKVDTRHKVAQKNADSSKHVEKEDVYRRQRDPDAMIASLDRLTATLVQQTEAIRERDSSAMKQSILSDTWNEDSPNDVSFPSISISAPIIASFKSDVPEEQGTITSECYETASSENGHMTNSKIIQREAIKLAEAVDAEMNRQHELDTTSMTSMDLEAIKPPSTMGSLLSLTASYAGSGDCSESFVNRDRCNSASLPPLQVKNVSSPDSRNCRKKSLPLGVVAKRALNQAQSYTGSLENLLNECTGSHLENVKPPSMMDDLPDVGDMENSMLSVASITSEVADSKDQDSQHLSGSDAVFDLLKPVANVLSMTCMRYAEAMQNSQNNSLSECLENINPPSLFNEVCEMDESTMEQATETLCSDTLCIDVELHTEEAPHPVMVDRIDEAGNDTDEAVTPISSEYCGTSSAESTPRKRLYRNLTPKQKRTLAKERYKTYTIAAELSKKEEEQRQNGNNIGEDKVPRGKCSPYSKLTPKQRRQEDRARFQTQVLENPFPDLNQDQNNQHEVNATICEQENSDKPAEPVSPVKSSIPTLTKFSACKALIKKRAEQKKNRERYRTRTLNDSECIFKDVESNAIAAEERIPDSTQNIQSDEIQTMLEQNATIVLNTLNESNKANDNGEEGLLDCETISLVSNESESERNLRMRFVNGVSKKLIGSCAQQMDNVQEPEDNHKETTEIETPRSQEDIRYTDNVDTDSEDESNNTEGPPRETKRPRIIKPGMVRDPSNDSNATDKSDPDSPKAIRGRRKALYSNPITRKPTPQSSPLKQVNPVSGIPIGRSNTSPIVRATRATTLRQNNNSPSGGAKESAKPNTSPKTASNSTDDKKSKILSVAAKRASVPQKGSSLTFTKSVKRHSTPPTCSSSNYQQETKQDATVKPIERQGTFTKEEPEVENAPTVVSSSSSPIKTKIAKPIRGATSKVHPTTGKPKISPKTHQVHPSKSSKGNVSEKIQASKALPLLVAPKRLPTGKVTATPKIPANNQNATQAENGKIFRKVGPLGQRSNSNSSIVSNSSTGMQTRKLAKEATSKIASLWKKVEENKNKQRFEKPDTRQWLQPGNCANDVDAPSPVSNPPAFRLFRSSTFEGVPQDNDSPESALYKSKLKRPLVVGVQPSKVKYRNSCDLSGMNANDAPCKIPVKSSDASPYKKDTVDVGDTSVVLRKHAESSATEVDPTKRISRLGSFIRVDPANAEGSAQTYVNGAGVRTPASAIVPPFNYNPKQDILSQTTKVTPDESESKFRVTDCHSDIVTASTRVTTV